MRYFHYVEGGRFDIVQKWGVRHVLDIKMPRHEMHRALLARPYLVASSEWLVG